MAKIIAIQVSAETKQAQKALADVNSTLQEQEDILDAISREITCLLYTSPSPRDS